MSSNHPIPNEALYIIKKMNEVMSDALIFFKNQYARNIMIGVITETLFVIKNCLNEFDKIELDDEAAEEFVDEYIKFKEYCEELGQVIEKINLWW